MPAATVSVEYTRPPRHHPFWPPRLPHRLTPPETSLWHNLAISALRYPQHPATIFFGSVCSYRTLAQQVERLAGWLQQRGVRRGDRVLLMLQNSPQLLVAHFAILRADAVVVPVNPMNRAAELRHYITDADARVAICAADLASEMADASDGLPAGTGLHHLLRTHYHDAFDTEVQGADAPPPAWREWLCTRHPAPVLQGGAVDDWPAALACDAAAAPSVAEAGDIALLPYTSGTTGHPKGCMHTHRGMQHQAAAYTLVSGGSPENRMLVVAPQFHVTGMAAAHGAVYAGATMVLMPRWDRDLAGRLIARWRVTHWTSIPTMVIDLLAAPDIARYDLSSLVYAGGGGSAMPQAVAQRLFERTGLRYAEGYGLTETAAASHQNPFDATKQQCLGVPFMSVESRVVDPVTLQTLPPGEVGEILIHGPQVFQGYWKQPAATEAVFVELDGKRFFRSGDLGTMDEDGYYFLTDRLKRMINASGFKVWPAEVENLMFGHPAVQEACIIASPDDYRGQTVKAVVVLRPAYRGNLREDDLIAWCRDHMAVYKAPRIVEFAETLPKSGSGKVMWRQLQEAEFRRHASGGPTPAIAS